MLKYKIIIVIINTIKIKHHCVEYYNAESDIKNTMKFFSVMQIFLNLLTISGILLLVLLLNEC